MNRNWAVIIALLMLSACASRAVREPPSPLVNFAPEINLQEVWTQSVGVPASGSVGLVPKLDGEFIYTADREGHVSAFAVNSGKQRWSTALKTKVRGGVGAGDNLVLVGTRRGEVIALKQENGEVLWKSQVSSEVLAPPSVGGGVVVAQAVDGKLFGLAAADGKRLWVDQRNEPALSLRGTATPVIVGDQVITGFANGRVVAMDLRTGRSLWEAPLGQPRGRNEIERLVDIDATPLVMTDAIYAAAYQGKVAALQPSTGAMGWARDVSVYSGLATDGGNIYVTDDSGRVLALDRKNGASVWKQENLRGRGLTAPTVYRDYVIVSDYEGYVHWLARSDGHFVVRHRVDDGPVRAPAMTDGDLVFVVDSAGTLSGMRPSAK